MADLSQLGIASGFPAAVPEPALANESSLDGALKLTYPPIAFTLSAANFCLSAGAIHSPNRIVLAVTMPRNNRSVNLGRLRPITWMNDLT
jgi:hypothetical protein